jgi:hypothetical protein
MSYFLTIQYCSFNILQIAGQWSEIILPIARGFVRVIDENCKFLKALVAEKIVGLL